MQYLIVTHKITGQAFLVRDNPTYACKQILKKGKWENGGWFSNDYKVTAKANIKLKNK